MMTYFGDVGMAGKLKGNGVFGAELTGEEIAQTLTGTVTSTVHVH